MKKSLVRIAALALATGTLSTPASAAIALGTPTQYCLNAGGFSACATLTVSVAANLATVTLLNGGGNTTYQLSSFGFFVTPADAAQAGIFSLTSGPTGWADTGAIPGNGLNNPSQGTFLGSASANDGPDRLIPTQSGIFVFDIGSFDSWGSTHFAFRGQNWSDGGALNQQSFKCIEGGTSNAGGVGTAVVTCTPTVVPEPATMALLGTGLVGLAGAGLIRRRRSA